MALFADGFSTAKPSRAALWQGASAGRHDDSGLAGQLRRTRALLRPVSKSCAGPPARPAIFCGEKQAGRQSLRRLALGGISDAAAEADTWRHVFAEAARKSGHSPFPQPAANLSEAYVNPLGVKLGQCTYCGFCERFGCGNYAKGEPANLRAAGALAFAEFHRQTECEVARINLDGDRQARYQRVLRRSGGRGMGAAGRYRPRMRILSVQCASDAAVGHRQALRSAERAGVVGRNYAYQVMSGVNVILKDKTLNPFIATGATA